jgi:exosortase D (VPLPA-CTERM-specific)
MTLSRRPGGSYWQLGILAALLLWLYGSTLGHLVLQWWQDPNFSHGFFVPLFSAFVLWQERGELARLTPRPSWTGLLIVTFGLCVMIIGRMGAELFLSRSSLLLVLAGLIVLFLGWRFFHAVFFPWAFLILMIPIPAIILNQVTLPLQLLAAKVAATVLPWLGVPVLREGNIIYLPRMPLEVAEACSGIRSLMSLVTLAIIYGYLMERRRWVRWLLALASVPITVIANDVRIVGTGLLVQYWDPAIAEGYYHASWGWLIFVVSLVMLYALHLFIRFLFADKNGESITAPSSPTATIISAGLKVGTASVILSTVLLAIAATFLQLHAGNEVFPPRRELHEFPTQLGGWTGTDIPLDQDTLEKLGHGDFLNREYVDLEKSPPIYMFIAYYPSQRAGDSPHSPQNCRRGSGWTPLENQRITLAMPGHEPFPANRFFIAKGDARQLVLYWFWAHDRGVASEWCAKYYLVKDSMRINRSDGSIVSITARMDPGETPGTAQQRIQPFVDKVLPLLDTFIPQ